MSSYTNAQKAYLALGVDTEAALKRLDDLTVSVHCWQGDDVSGFDSAEALSGGIQTTGNYPGKARDPQELMDDLDLVFSLTPGKKKLNLHACYAIGEAGEALDRSALEPRHFAPWVQFAKDRGMGIDFNPTFFSHPMVKDDLTLTSPDPEIRAYWIRHGQCCLKLSQYFAEQTGFPCVMNIWIPDGYKNIPGDRMGPRARFRQSLDEILSISYNKKQVYVTLESKVFGIGLEAYTAGSAEFCLSYAASRGITPLMDNGHYHPTELVSDKLSSLLLFHDKIALHITRPMRWDSDHVVLFDDETKEIATEIVRCNALDRVFVATDYFDASINRICAWVTGLRSVRMAFLYALLRPTDTEIELQNKASFSELMALQESLKTAPFGAVWQEYLHRTGVEENYWREIQKYEKEVLVKRT